MISLILGFLFCAAVFAVEDGEIERNDANCAKTCKFRGADADDCYVLGRVQNQGELVLWEKATQDCLDALNIKSQAIDEFLLKRIWPNADGSGAKASTLTTEMRLGSLPGVVATIVRDSFPAYFEDGKFKDDISYGDSTQTGCQDSGNARDCYTVFKEFLEGDADGKRIFEDIGRIQYNVAANNLERDQGVARTAVCAAAIGSEQGDADRVMAVDQNCAALKTQLVKLSATLFKDALVDGTDQVQCSSYQFGPGTLGCDGMVTAAPEGVPAGEPEGQTPGEGPAGQTPGQTGPSDDDRGFPTDSAIIFAISPLAIMFVAMLL